VGSGGRYDKSGGRRPPIRLAASTLILTPLALVIDRLWTLSSRLARASATNLLLVSS